MPTNNTGIITDVVIDFETFGITPNAEIRSLGYAAIRSYSPDKPIEFLTCDEWVVFNKLHGFQLGRETNDDTILWWQQAELTEANERINAAQKITLETMLLRFESLIAEYRCFGDVRIWGNGADFDCAILANLVRHAHSVGNRLIGRAYSFKNYRCFRTMKDIHSNVPKPESFRELSFMKHNAKDDALAEVLWLRNILESLRG